MRLRALQFFNADPEQFDLVFVANATAAIKMVMEAFRENKGGFWYGYHKDAHTSLVGVREVARFGGRCFMSDREVEEWLQEAASDRTLQDEDGLYLFAYPAQSNMNGRRLPLDWPSRLRTSKHGETTYSLLDAAALVSTAPLDLSDQSQAPDFTVLSFYKIFGFPDLGALVVRKKSGSILRQRRYFGGGTVELVACGKENWHIQKQGSLHGQLEDGTLPIHSIIALDSALSTHWKLYGDMKRVASHTAFLALWLHHDLEALRHYNDMKVCEIYKDPSSSYSDGKTQGPIIALNLKNSRGDFINGTEVEKLANIRNIQIRSGGLCNPGGIASSLGLAPWELRRNFSAGQRCGGENDIVHGKPTGMLRISVGAMSHSRDIATFVDFVREFFLEQSPPELLAGEECSSQSSFYVETLTVYPVKSCGGWAIPSNASWVIREEGLAWDREWCVVPHGTRNALSQKKYPSMSLLKPRIDLPNGLLRVRYHGPIPPNIDSEISVPLSADPTVFQQYANGMPSSPSQVCGDDFAAQLYASPAIAAFFTTLLGTPCTLARFPAASPGLSTRHSKAHLNPAISQIKRPLLLSNESPILAISRSSLNRLNEQIKQKEGKAAHASVFRANLILAEQPLHPGYEQPYIEDDWEALHIGDGVKLDVLGGCRRCQMVCVDQMTAEKNEEPFVTLAKTRRRAGRVLFGVHAALCDARKSGSIARVRVGDRVRPVAKSA